MPHDAADYSRHLHLAEAKAKTYAIDAFEQVEQLAGWAHVAQVDGSILEATVEARSAIRRVRNLLNPDTDFVDDPQSFDILGGR